MAIYHIAIQSEWQAGLDKGSYKPAGFERDGFIHFSKKEQVLRVANGLYANRSDLVLLKVDPKRVSCPVIEENLEGGSELFPHLYGPLPSAAVIATAPLTWQTEGYSFPNSLED